MNRFESFQAFYPYYLSEHRNGACRLLHFIVTTGVLGAFVFALVTGQLALILACPVIGYGSAWVGHFIFEKNRPATFQYPLWSLRGDFVMYADILFGEVPLFGDLPERFYEGHELSQHGQMTEP